LQTAALPLRHRTKYDIILSLLGVSSKVTVPIEKSCYYQKGVYCPTGAVIRSRFARWRREKEKEKPDWDKVNELYNEAADLRRDQCTGCERIGTSGQQSFWARWERFLEGVANQS
jgi:hypothetical protein